MEKNQHEQHVGNISHYFRQTMRIMRLSLFFMVVSTAIAWSASTYSQSTKLSVNLRDATVREVIKAIEEQSEFLFLYQEGQVDLNRRVSIRAEGKQLQEILDEVFKGTDNIYIVSDRQVVIGKAPRKALEAQLSALQKDLKTVIQQPQQKEITGKVTDTSGEPLPGATVMVKGTTIGTVTDADGNFTLRIPANAQTLQISFVGMKMQEIPIAGRTTFNVQLEEEAVALQEVVAVGYGTVRKSDLTGAVASIKGEDLLLTNPQSFNQALQGKLAGVQVQQADGAPGAGVNIVIRGANSFTTNCEPLYVVDGVPFNVGEPPAPDAYGDKQRFNPLSMINPNDIESIEVLKDASAAAIYGSRGANGVVLITTKGKGVSKPKINFNTNFGISNVVKKINVLDAATYAEYRNEAAINGYKYDGKEYVSDDDLPFPGRWSYTTIEDPETGVEVVVDSTYLPSPQDFRDGYLNGGTDWQDQIFQTAIIQEYNLSYSEGSEKGHNLFSVGILNQDGIIYNSFYRRYTLRSNFSRKVSKWIEIGNNLSFAKSTNRLTRTNTESYGVIPSAIGFNPTRPVFDPERDSGYTEDTATGLANPYLYTRTAKNLVGVLNISNSAYAEITFIDFLKFRQNVGYGNTKNTRNEYYNRWLGEGLAPKNGFGRQADNFYESLVLESLLQYNKVFNMVHRVDAVFGWTYEKADWGDKSMSASGFPNDLTEENDMGAAIDPNPLSSGRGESSLVSYLGRVNYSLLDRYLFTMSFRRDGSSRFSKNNRWSNFSSFAFAWRISDEEFIKKIGFFDNLKLRLSYGQTGNQGISAYATRSRMEAQNYPYDGSLTSGYAESRWGGPANPNLKWETTTQADVGIDVSFLSNRVNFVFDLYYKKTNDLLQYRLIPGSTGFTSLVSNYGNVKNKGVELMGSFDIYSQKNFGWKIDANVSHNKNIIGGLEAAQFSDVCWGMESMFIRRNGDPIGLIYGYQEDGFYDNEAEVRADPKYRNESDAKIRSMIGQVKYKDNNNDNVIDDRDKVVIGNTNPNLLYGLTNSFRIKDFSLSIFLQGVYGNDILNVNLKPYDVSGTLNMPHFVYDNRWTEQNKKNATAPRPDMTYTRSLKASDRYVENGSYLRVKNISLSYLFRQPIEWIQSLRVNLSVNNPFTITKYRWYDPDVNTFGGDVSRRGVDMASYPSARTVFMSFNIEF